MADNIWFIISSFKLLGSISSQINPIVYKAANLMLSCSELAFFDKTDMMSSHIFKGISMDAIADTQLAAALMIVVSSFAS